MRDPDVSTGDPLRELDVPAGADDKRGTSKGVNKLKGAELTPL